MVVLWATYLQPRVIEIFAMPPYLDDSAFNHLTRVLLKYPNGVPILSEPTAKAKANETTANRKAAVRGDEDRDSRASRMSRRNSTRSAASQCGRFSGQTPEPMRRSNTVSLMVHTTMS